MARVMAGNRGARAVGGRQTTHSIRTMYWLSIRASTGSFLLRSPSDSAKQRARRGFARLTST